MAELKQRWRLVLGWVMTLVVIAYAISDWGPDNTPKLQATSEETEEATTLRIVSISDGEVNAGDAVVVKFSGAAPSPPIEVHVAKKHAEILSQEQGTLVVRIPPELPPGKAALRLHQGTTKSKAWDLHVRVANHKKLIARLLGGLALFVLGLGLLALGLRGLAGHRLRTLLGKLTGSPARALGVGALVGTGTQLTSSSAALTVSLVDARMVRPAAAVAILVGAQLGASITGALIPAQLASESLLVIVIGVLWSRLSRTRRGTAIANLVLGAGLMLYGLHLLQTSVDPLVSDPKILPYVDHLREHGVAAIVLCALTGALLAFVLQGPGPVYVLVVGLVQTTTAIPLVNALAVIVGTNLGAGLAMALIAYARTSSRSLAGPHLAFSIIATVITVATAPLWASLAERLAPESLAYGHSVVRPNIAAQLAIGFIGAQLLAGAVWLLVLPRLATRMSLVRKASPRTESFGAVINESLVRLRLALEIAIETACAGERGRSPDADHALREARERLEARYQAVDQEATDERQVRALVSALQLQRAIEQAVNAAELCVERNVRIGDDTKERLTAMSVIAGESFDALLTAISVGESPDLEDAGAREIRMNALEAEGRKHAVARRKRPDTATGLRNSTNSISMGIAELVDSFENVGNHLFRLAKALADETDY